MKRTENDLRFYGLNPANQRKVLVDNVTLKRELHLDAQRALRRFDEDAAGIHTDDWLRDPSGLVPDARVLRIEFTASGEPWRIKVRPNRKDGTPSRNTRDLYGGEWTSYTVIHPEDES